MFLICWTRYIKEWIQNTKGNQMYQPVNTNYKRHPDLSPNKYKTECDKYIRIFEYSNIFDPNIYSYIRSYHFLDTNIFVHSFVSTFWIRIYSDIRSCQFFDTNIFGYSFVARFWYEYIRIFVCINFQILTMFLFNFHGYYTLLMDILLITMIKNAI